MFYIHIYFTAFWRDPDIDPDSTESFRSWKMTDYDPVYNCYVAGKPTRGGAVYQPRLSHLVPC
jgi:hypothetical protein